MTSEAHSTQYAHRTAAELRLGARLRAQWPTLEVRYIEISIGLNGTPDVTVHLAGTREALLMSGVIEAEEIDTLPPCGSTSCFEWSDALSNIRRLARGRFGVQLFGNEVFGRLESLQRRLGFRIDACAPPMQRPRLVWINPTRS